jgi:DivIVA domain-containing protein
MIAVMSLTPEDVQQKRFSAVRFKEGYDEVEVDAFLDEVTNELRRLNARVAELEAQLADR